MHSSLFLWHHSTQCLFAFLFPLGVWLICLSQARSIAVWKEKKRKKKDTLFPLQNYMCMEQSRLNKLNYPVHSKTYAAFWSVMEIRKVRRISFYPPFRPPSLINKPFFHSSLLPGACHVCSVHVKGKGVSGTGPSLNSFLIETLKNRRNFPWEGIRVFVILSLKEAVTGGGRAL